MRAKVIGFESAEMYNDHRQRIVLKFLDAGLSANVVKFPSGVTGLSGAVLDDIVEVAFDCPAIAARRSEGTGGQS